ncbi:MAG: sulfite exporter TauE/SafE family protein [archaeon]|nr:sulfite exporter TauE/SafE family protein [archaeon]
MKIMEMILILLVLAISMLIGSILGFGDLLILIPFMTLFIDVRISIILAGFWTFYLTIFNLVKYRKFLDKSFLIKYIIPGIPGVILGALLINIAPLRLIEFILGTFIVIYVLFKLKKVRNENSSKNSTESLTKAETMDKKTLSDSIILTGGFSFGLLGGLIGASGPICAITLEKIGHKRESFIGNFNAVGFILSSIKISVYLMNGMFPNEHLVLYLLGIPIILLATKLGHKITPKIPHGLFQNFILLLMIIIGLKSIISALFLY